MAGYRRKIGALVVVMAVSGCLIVAARGASRPLRNESGKPLFSSGAFSLASDPNSSAVPGKNPSTRELFFKMMLAVLIVVGLGLAVIIISKKVLPKITNPAGKTVQVLETTHLGPRKAIHLLKIGNQRLLVGSTNEKITKLADVTYALTDSGAEAENN